MKKIILLALFLLLIIPARSWGDHLDMERVRAEMGVYILAHDTEAGVKDWKINPCTRNSARSVTCDYNVYNFQGARLCGGRIRIAFRSRVIPITKHTVLADSCLDLVAQ